MNSELGAALAVFASMAVGVLVGTATGSENLGFATGVVFLIVAALLVSRVNTQRSLRRMDGEARDEEVRELRRRLDELEQRDRGETPAPVTAPRPIADEEDTRPSTFPPYVAASASEGPVFPPDTMTTFQSLDEVVDAIARLGNNTSRTLYVERLDNLYRWSIAHRGGPYPLLREIAQALGVPHQSLVLPFTTVDGWCVVARAVEDLPAATACAFLESSGSAFLVRSQILDRCGDEEAAWALVNGGRKIRVVIVDDIDDTVRTLVQLIGYEPDLEVVGTACDGEASIPVIGELEPDIVLMDICMPVMDGITATARVTVAPAWHGAVIVMSVQGDAEQRRRAALAGAAEFLEKPFSADELINAIRHVDTRTRSRSVVS